ncbi:unnamed protein product [Lupinus luteus]|uniref:Peptidase A1 domain-containing protein n=1 Tax=Lupinus luteus TaxID=3873 RepID=A0AAV1XXQ5_LUPLU
MGGKEFYDISPLDNMKEIALFVGILFQLSVLSSAESKGFSVDLIHIDSPLSPFYNSSMTQSDLVIRAAFNSISRAKSLSLNIAGNRDETAVVQSGGTYIMGYYIGSIPTGTAAVLDTGSDLTWIQCVPCTKCYNQKLPLFNPRKSSTFNFVPCTSTSCKKVTGSTCGKFGDCVYKLIYGNNFTSQGKVATDTISFNSSYNGRIIKYPNTILGCGYNNTGEFHDSMSGIFGLGGGPSSFISQYGNQFGKRKFSYCLLPRTHHASSSLSKLKFGVDTQTNRRTVITTPMVSLHSPTHYFIGLDSVSVNGKVVKPNESSFGNVIIDSGTTVTFLRTSWYERIETAVIEAIGREIVPLRRAVPPFRLCYKFESVRFFPTIRLRFYGALYNLRLNAVNTFVSIEDKLCFAIVPTESLQIIGNLVQSFFNIEYDLEDRTVSFASADCAKE